MTSALCWCTALALASPRSVTAFMSLPSHPHPSLELARPHSSSWHPAAKAREAAVAHRRCTNGSRRQTRASCMMVGAVPSLGAGLAGALLKGGLGVAVGFVLGLLGGGGSILALPIFLEVFHEPSATAIAESLLVVAVGAGVGLLAKLDSVNISQLVPLATMAMVGSAAMARIAPGIPDIIRLGIFCIFAVYSAVSMLRSVQSPAQPSSAGFPPAKGRPSPQKARVAATAAASMTTTSTVTLYALLIGVGALTSIIGAGGGFVIVPVLTGFAAMEMKSAVGSSLLIICLNSLVGFASYFGVVPIHSEVVLPFAGAVAGGALLGNALSNSVPQPTVKRAFAWTILAFGSALVAVKLPPLLDTLYLSNI